VIICQNCGTTNNELITQVCRTCGALLPVSSRTRRSRATKEEKDKKKKKKEKKTTKENLEKNAKIEEPKQENLDLQEIPSSINEGVSSAKDYQEIPKLDTEKTEEYGSNESTQSQGGKRPETLQEITPKPFRGSVIKPPKILKPLPSQTQDPISDAFSELKESVLTKEAEKSKTPISPVPTEHTRPDTIALKQKRLEEDMSKVLGFLSKKISVKKYEKPSVKPQKKEKVEEIPPTSINEILKRLLVLDLNIEASAVIKIDGTILASAISSRISDSLFATIGMNLSMIGTDIVDGLNAGVLKSISVKGTDGVLDLAPIDRDNPRVKDMILILFSHSKVKSGIISFAVNIVKKQIKAYLGVEK
jgi:predicted regulator of Ras-like GTPase activity (Roadblock/LC7/MglB family)